MKSLFRPMANQIRRISSEDNQQEVRIAHVERQFDATPQKQRTKESFMAAIAAFKEKRSRAHVEFINTALKYMKEYGAHKDLDTYKSLLNIFPKGPLIPQNTFQRIMLHYPMQQNCCVKVLDEMEWHGVQPDKELHDIVVNAFGEWNFATRKAKRMMYWMPKLKHTNKYLDRRNVEGKKLDPAELAAHALRMISRDPATALAYVKTTREDSGEGWIASAQSPAQQRLIHSLPDRTEIFVDGPFRVFVMDRQVQYVQMTCSPTPAPFEEFQKHDMIEDVTYTDWFEEWKTERSKKWRTLHEQEHETILALAVFSVVDNKAAQQWVEHLQQGVARLEQMQLRLRLEGEEPELKAESRSSSV